MPDEKDMRPFACVLAVPDMEASARYFRDILGFEIGWADASDWRLVSRGAVRIMLGHCPAALRPTEIGDHNFFGYFEVDEADVLHREWASKGAVILEPPTDRPYGMREFVVASPDGHRFVVGSVCSVAGHD